MEIDGEEYFSLPFAPSSLCHKNAQIWTHTHTLIHGHTSSLSLSYMKSTHNYEASCSQLQGNLSAGWVWSQWAALHC